MTKFHLIAAAAACAAMGSAQALTPAEIDAARTAGTLKEVRIAGASALRLSVAAYLNEICTNSAVTPATNDLHVYFDNSATPGNNHRAYACTLGVAVGNFPAGTPVLVYKRDAGGSGQGVAPIVNGSVQQHLVVNAASCSIPTSPAPGGDPAVSDYRCTTLSNADGDTAGALPIISDAGISDVEPTLLNATINTAAVLPATAVSNLNTASLVQAVFGVAVNKKTYRALQEAQGIIPVGGALLDIPADQNLLSDPAVQATIPSLPREWLAGALTQFVSGGAANARGWNIVIPNRAYSLDGGVTTRAAVDVDSAAKTVNVCRRARGSGTQASSNAFFLQNPCNAGTAAYTPGGSQTANATTVAATLLGSSVFQSGASAGEVEDCLGEVENVAGGNAYGFGVLGREANPLRSGTDRNYRYVKINGQAPLRTEAKAGRYGFVYEATMQWSNTTLSGQADKIAFLTALRSNFGKPSALAAVDADTQQGVMSPPATYTGSYDSFQANPALDPAVTAFGSRVSRVSNLSCAPLREVK
jgi:hypothetical protein